MMVKAKLYNVWGLRKLMFRDLNMCGWMMNVNNFALDYLKKWCMGVVLKMQNQC